MFSETAAVRSAAALLLSLAAALFRGRISINGLTHPNGYSIIQSATLCPGGAGVSAAPGADLSLRDLTKAALWHTNLTDANLSAAILVDAQLTNATLIRANLSGADLSHAACYSATLTTPS